MGEREEMRVGEIVGVSKTERVSGKYGRVRKRGRERWWKEGKRRREGRDGVRKRKKVRTEWCEREGGRERW